MFRDGERVKLGGPYTLQLYDIPSRQMKQVTVDDRLFCDGSRPTFSKSSDDMELWCPIIEKALAAHCGGWDAIEGGQPTFAWCLMTGCEDCYQFRRADGQWKCLQSDYRKYKSNSPKSGDGKLAVVPFPKMDESEPCKTADDELFWDYMCAWDDTDFVMGAGSAAGSDTNTTQGIVDGHAYTVITCKNDVGKDKFDMVLIRNPHGKTEFEARWREGGKEWDQHPDVKAALNPKIADDGLFWMQKEDFFQFFGTLYLLAQDMTP